MTVTLTATIARKARPADKEYALHDASQPGFFLRVQPSGAKSWCIRIGARRVTLAAIGELSLRDARAEARALLRREARPSREAPSSRPDLRRTRCAFPDGHGGPLCGHDLRALAFLSQLPAAADIRRDTHRPVQVLPDRGLVFQLFPHRPGRRECGAWASAHHPVLCPGSRASGPERAGPHGPHHPHPTARARTIAQFSATQTPRPGPVPAPLGAQCRPPRPSASPF